MKRCAHTGEILQLVVFCIALFSLPLIALAQGASPPAFGQPTAAAPANTVNCFDYYHLGSVQENYHLPLQVPSPAQISRSGTLNNVNPYPIVDSGFQSGAIAIKNGQTKRFTNASSVTLSLKVPASLGIPSAPIVQHRLRGGDLPQERHVYATERLGSEHYSDNTVIV